MSITSQIGIFAFGALLISVLSAPAASAADCKSGARAGASYFEELDALLGRACYREEARKTELGVRVTQILDTQDTLSAPEKANQALTEIVVYLTENYDRGNVIQTEYTDVMSNALLELREDIKHRPVTPPPNLRRDWQFSQLGRPPRPLRGIDFSKILPNDTCGRFDAGNCNTEMAFAVQLVQAALLTLDAIDSYTEDYRGDVLADRKLRRTKWDSYYDDLTFQYPWELWANSYLLKLTDDRKVEDGNRLGFRSLPGSKIVLIHPEVNLVYSQDSETEYDTAVTFEVLGFENFDFDVTGKIDNSYGLSLMAAYLDRPDGSDSGWTGGLMLKLNGYSLGITENHGEYSYILNINLSQRLFDVKQDARRYYDEYEEKLNQLKGKSEVGAN